MKALRWSNARLPDGSRVNVVIPPISLIGPTITIRKFAKTPLQVEDLIRFGTITPEAVDFLKACILARLNIVISGGTGSGKTTLLNVLSGFLPNDERIITIEDAAELQLRQEHVVTLEARPPNVEGKGEVTIRDLVINSLRMRPDRIIVGEVRGEEARVWAQAIMTGHGGVTSLHSESPRAAIQRLLSPPISVDRGALGSLGGILYIAKLSSRSGNRAIQRRRALNFFDIGNDLECKPLFHYDFSSDSFSTDEDVLASSNIGARITEEAGITTSTFLEKYRDKSRIPE